MRLSIDNLHYLAANPRQVTEFLNSLADYICGDVVMEIFPTSVQLDAAIAALGAQVYFKVSFKNANGDVLKCLDGFTLSAAVADTIVHAASIPVISDATPNIVDGEVMLSLDYVNGGTYVDGEDATVTIANFTTPDGRTINGGTFVVSFPV